MKQCRIPVIYLHYKKQNGKYILQLVYRCCIICACLPGSLIFSIASTYRYMKFATAVYGPEMVVAARVANTNDRTHALSRLSSIEHIVTSHLDGIELGNILDKDIEAGDSRDYLRYMVVLDPTKKAVVLAIRGTLGLSSLGSAYSFFPEEFCGGMAHGGFAKIARAVWARAEASIRAQLQQLAPQGYSLVITGHSAGASVASLITIMLYHKKPLPPDVRVQCMAYGPMYCFSPLDAAAEAVQNTTAYVHNYDIVTSLSVLSLRFFIRCIADIDIELMRLPIHQRMAFYSGWRIPPEKLGRAIDVARSESLPTSEGQPLLLIPAKCTVRLGNRGQDANGASYSTTFLDPLKHPCRIVSLFDAVDTSAFDNHSPISYEGAFQALTARQAPVEQMEPKLCHAPSLPVEAAEESKTTRVSDDDDPGSNSNVPPLLCRASVYSSSSDEDSSLSDYILRANAYSSSSDEDSSLADDVDDDATLSASSTSGT